MHLEALSIHVLFVLLLVAVLHDVRSRRIPNWLILTGIVLAFVFQALDRFGGFEFYVQTVKYALLGGLVGFLLFVPMYALKLLGAGDVKLLAMVGLWLGPMDTLQTALYTLIAGGILALVWSAVTGTLRQVLSNLHAMFASSFMNVSAGGGLLLVKPQTSTRLPYAIAIACGAVFVLFSRTFY